MKQWATFNIWHQRLAGEEEKNSILARKKNREWMNSKRQTESTAVIMLSMRLYDIHITLVIRRLSIFNRDNNAFHRFYSSKFFFLRFSIVFFGHFMFCYKSKYEFLSFERYIVGVHVAANGWDCFVQHICTTRLAIKHFRIMRFCNRWTSKKKHSELTTLFWLQRMIIKRFREKRNCWNLR